MRKMSGRYGFCRCAVCVVVILLCAVSGHCGGRRLYVDSRTGFAPFVGGEVSSDALTVRRTATAPTGGSDGDFSFTARLRLCRGRGAYVISLADSIGGGTLVLRVEPQLVDDPVRGTDSSLLSLSVINAGGSHLLAEASLRHGDFDSGSGFNIVKIERLGDVLGVSAGRTHARPVMWLQGAARHFGGDISSVTVAPAAEDAVVELDCAQMSADNSSRRRLDTGFQAAELERMAAAASGKSGAYGVWTMLDFDVDDRYLRPGGDYRLAVVPLSELATGSVSMAELAADSPEDTVALVYLSGARVSAGLWHPGMLKGLLMPASVDRTWRVVWYDAAGEELAPAPAVDLATAALDADSRILQFTFPERYSSVRFMRQRTSGGPEAGN